MKKLNQTLIAAAIASALALPAYAQDAADQQAQEGEKTEQAASPAIFSKDFKAVEVEVEYKDDPRVAYLNKLVSAVEQATPEQLEAFEPMVVTAETFLTNPQMAGVLKKLTEGKLVVVDRKGNTVTSGEKGAFVGRIHVDFRDAKKGFLVAQSAMKPEVKRFILDHVRVNKPVSLNDYTSMLKTSLVMDERVGAEDFPLLSQRVSPSFNQETDPQPRYAKVDDQFREADLYYALGGEIKDAQESAVYIKAEFPWTVLAFSGGSGIELDQEAETALMGTHGAFSRMGVKTINLGNVEVGNDDPVSVIHKWAKANKIKPEDIPGS